MSKSEKYASSKGEEDMEELTERLAQDLRRSIRSLTSCAVLSDAWLECAETFGRIANISDMESKLSQEKGGSSATLWETEEQALRFLLEDGKLNFSLRSMVDYKREQRQAIENGKRGIIFQQVAECDKFERGLGVVLRNAWSHVESLQTTDMSLLLNYMGDVILFASEHPAELREYCDAGDIHQRQEVLVFYYIFSVMQNIETLHEESIMADVRSHRIFINGVKVLSTIYRSVSNVHSIKIIEALSMIADSEDYKTYTDRYIRNADEARILFDIKANIITPLCTSVDYRRLSRSLSDACEKAKRLYKLN